MNCPVCHSEKKSFLFTAYDILYRMVEDKFTVYKCQGCFAVFLSPFPTQEETEKFYPKNYYSYDTTESDGFFESLKKKIIESKMDGKATLNWKERLLVFMFQNKFSGIPLYRKDGGKFLDIGCGSGKNLNILNRYGWDTYGIELDADAVRHAKSEGLKVERSSIETANFGDIKFDSIRIWHVFEHLTDPQEATEKLKDWLADDGEILMALPNAHSWARIIFGRYWYGLDVPRHVISYSPETLSFLMEKNGLKISELKYSSCGSFVGSISNFFRRECGYHGNLVNNIFLIFLFAPLDYLSDIFKRGDTIFLRIQKNG